MSRPRPVIFGEVLFDCFPDRSTLGGAPFNVAWHLKGFGLEPLFISRVGEDSRGETVRHAMRAWGMDLSGLETDPDHPTGAVQVELVEGEPSYTILPAQAYDFIEASGWRADCGAALLYHGSLALREETSRRGLLRVKKTGLPRFVDINLRQPWWRLEDARELARGANVLKLNADELRLLGGDGAAIQESARRLHEQLELGTLLVTQGEGGAFARTSDGTVVSVPAAPVAQMVDAVGAGDGFSAVIIAGMLKGWPWAVSLRRAARFAARVCGWRGAFQQDRSPYEETLAHWNDDNEN